MNKATIVDIIISSTIEFYKNKVKYIPVNDEHRIKMYSAFIHYNRSKFNGIDIRALILSINGGRNQQQNNND